MVLSSALRGGFFLRKKTLNCEASVYSNSEFALGRHSDTDVQAKEIRGSFGRAGRVDGAITWTGIAIDQTLRCAPPGRNNLIWMQPQDCVRCGGLHPPPHERRSVRGDPVPGLFSCLPYGKKAVASGVLVASETNSSSEGRSCDCLEFPNAVSL